MVKEEVVDQAWKQECIREEEMGKDGVQLDMSHEDREGCSCELVVMVVG